MGKRKIEGRCHLCGTYGPLTFEHIPPAAAFNKYPVIPLSHDQMFKLRPEESPKGPIQRRGMGAYTLCERCNNDTGAWYGYNFAHWCYEGMAILKRSGGNPTLFHVSYSYPLRILKQIVTMFFSLSTEQFRQKNEELVRFVLNKEMKYLSPQYKFFTYYNLEGRLRCSAPIAVLDTEKHTTSAFAEITFPPFGYVMTLGTPPPDDRLVDISGFARYGYYEYASISRRFPVLPTYMPMPGDYRPYKPALQKTAE